MPRGLTHIISTSSHFYIPTLILFSNFTAERRDIFPITTAGINHCFPFPTRTSASPFHPCSPHLRNAPCSRSFSRCARAFSSLVFPLLQQRGPFLDAFRGTSYFYLSLPELIHAEKYSTKITNEIDFAKDFSYACARCNKYYYSLISY